MENIRFEEIDQLLNKYNCQIEKVYLVGNVRYEIDFKKENHYQEFYEQVCSKVFVLNEENSKLCFEKECLDKEDELYVYKHFIGNHKNLQKRKIKFKQRYRELDYNVTFEEIDRIIEKVIHDKSKYEIERTYHEDKANYDIYIHAVDNKLIDQLCSLLSRKIKINKQEKKHPKYKNIVQISFSKKYCSNSDRKYFISKFLDEDV